MGVGKLNLPGKPSDMPTKQAAAAVGQCELMYTYDRLFLQYNHTVAQILLTERTWTTPSAGRTLRTPWSACWSWAPCPSSTRTTPWPPLRSRWATTTPWGPLWPGASRPTCWSSSATLRACTPPTPEGPQRKLIPVVEEVTPEIEALAGGVGSGLATGGMATKLRAAKMVAEVGCDMIISQRGAPRGPLRHRRGEGRGDPVYREEVILFMRGDFAAPAASDFLDGQKVTKEPLGRRLRMSASRSYSPPP